MDFFEVIKKRRSIRKFTQTKVPQEVIQRALEAAVQAPTSSNGQTWDFYWVQTKENKEKMTSYCLDQSAARTASDLVVFVASPSSWKRSHPELIKWVKSVNAPKQVIFYYEKIFPLMYRWGFLNSIGIFKKISLNVTGLFKPIMRGPSTLGDIQEVCLKSVSLAAENFVLAISAQGYASCMMEGFDEFRVKRLLNLKCSDRIAMVVAVGEEAERGTWGPQFRLPIDLVVHKL